MDENHSIRFYRLSLGITNCFLLSIGEGYLLVDTSSENQYPAFKQKLNQLNINIDQIRYVFLSHHHTDHTGFLQNVLTESGAFLILHPNALPFLKLGINNPAMKPTTTLIAWFMKLRDYLSPAKPIRPFIPEEQKIIAVNDDNAMLPSIGLKGKILSLPGHTSDSICIVLENGDAFIGDVALNILGFIGLKHRPLVIEEPGLLAEAWNKLKNSGAKKLYVSHGREFNIDKLFQD